MACGRLRFPVTITPITAIRGSTSDDSGSNSPAKTMPAVARSAGMAHWR